MYWNESSTVLGVSMTFWDIMNALADPFGGPVMPAMSSIDAAKLLAKAAQNGLITHTGAHDDDLVLFDPTNLQDDLDPESETYRTLHAIKNILDEAGLKVNTITCSLHGNPIFRNGGLTNPDPKIRALAIEKVKRTLRIGAFLGASYFTYWVARDGYEVPVTVKWNQIFNWLAEGLNAAKRYIDEMGFTNYIGGTIEYKPNEPRGVAFIPTAGHSVAFILKFLDQPDFWGVNPELLQHDAMSLMDPLVTASFLCSSDKLFFLHFGGQISGEFDNDFPPLVGTEGLKKTVFLFWVLKKMNWRGIVEFDCHMLRSEADPENAEDSRYRFIENCVEALNIALTLADRIEDPEEGITQTEADLRSIKQMCGIV